MTDQRRDNPEIVAKAQCDNCGEWLVQFSTGMWRHQISGETYCVPPKSAMPRPDTIEAVS